MLIFFTTCQLYLSDLGTMVEWTDETFLCDPLQSDKFPISR